MRCLAMIFRNLSTFKWWCHCAPSPASPAATRAPEHGHNRLPSAQRTAVTLKKRAATVFTTCVIHHLIPKLLNSPHE